MKRTMLVFSVTMLLAAGAATMAFADIPAAGLPVGEITAAATPDQPVRKFKQLRAKKRAAMATLLGLSEAQQAQIKTILATARQYNAPLREKLASDGKKVKELAAATPFDETALRSLIASNETVRTDLAVARIKVRNQIQAVLTPDQKLKAEQLRLLNPEKEWAWRR